MTFSPGSLVAARGRDWVVLSHDAPDLVMVRPLGGTDDETTGILTAVESVEPASFGLPDPVRHLGDAHSARLLRDALRLGFRSGAGPFRSVARIGCDPRPYQLVPLLMALRLDPVRLLIADDVGVGKTIEAALVASELVAQGDAERLAVLCPPHLAEQWQAELRDKFHIDAELVLASTARRLERGLALGESIFERHPNVIVSIDFIKSDRRRNDFIRACPELVIVDEAHTCARSDERASSGRHQRHALVRDLARKADRHLILVTATPHSGSDAAFRSLLGLLDTEFGELPEDLTGEVNRHHRERLARHLVQRRRSEIQDFLGADTQFPDRAQTEVGYELSPDYRTLFDDALSYAKGSLSEHERGSRQQRIRKWSALGLLRALASSPAAAAATLRTRALTADTAGTDADDIDERGRRLVLDLDDAEEAPDVVPGSRLDSPGAESAVSRRLRQLAKQADEIASASTSKGADAKLDGLIEILGRLLADGFHPIVFCRFIDTAEYVAERLAVRLPKRARPQIATVTGRLPPVERESRIAELGEHPRRVLVCTDCLSEGINLQHHFSAVVHYDLPWNPTRLEQREGRVDRYGQSEPEVRVVTCWGTDNRIDETVLEVLLRKHRTIRSTLGISIPVPGSTSDIVEALAEQVLESSGQALQMPLEGIIEQLRPHTDALDAEWDRSARNEQRRRSLFAQSRIDPQEVHAELLKMQEAIGAGADTERFVVAALEAHGAAVAPRGTAEAASYDIDLSEVPGSVRDALAAPGAGGAAGRDADRLSVGFGPSVPDGAVRLSRTHPTVGGLAAYVLDRALDSAEARGPDIDGPSAGHGDGEQPSRHPPVAARCGVMRTGAVAIVTTLLLCRVRMSITASSRGGDHHMLAEEAVLLAFAGPSDSPRWLAPDETIELLAAEPAGNVAPAAASERIARILADQESWRPAVHAEAERRARALADAHRGVREADRRPGAAPRVAAVAAQRPVDVLAVYHFLPEARTS
ncbi:MAG: helicase-related protein [Acidimicrobiaceae bacterium]|nr:helicase-related protein [Acidimicrobiaceae bacterium]